MTGCSAESWYRYAELEEFMQLTVRCRPGLHSTCNYMDIVVFYNKICFQSRVTDIRYLEKAPGCPEEMKEGGICLCSTEFQNRRIIFIIKERLLTLSGSRTASGIWINCVVCSTWYWNQTNSVLLRIDLDIIIIEKALSVMWARLFKGMVFSNWAEADIMR